MNRNFRNFIVALGLTAGLAFAQGPNGPLGPGSAPRTNSGLNVAKQQTVEGVITSVQIAYGVQYPSIVVNKVQIEVAPVWYMLENDFELSAGEAVRVVAAPSNSASDPYLHAIEITKTGSGARITLRNAAGVPLWLGAAHRGGNVQAPHTYGTCVDTANITTVTGTIDRVAVGVAIQHPTLVLRVNETLLSIDLGPERILLDSDLQLKAGATLTVKYAPTTCGDEYVALQLVDAEGNAVVLRHDDGTPAWND